MRDMVSKLEPVPKPITEGQFDVGTPVATMNEKCTKTRIEIARLLRVSAPKGLPSVQNKRTRTNEQEKIRKIINSRLERCLK